MCRNLRSGSARLPRQLSSQIVRTLHGEFVEDDKLQEHLEMVGFGLCMCLIQLLLEGPFAHGARCALQCSICGQQLLNISQYLMYTVIAQYLIQDCCFAIPARKSPNTFDISDPSDHKELVFGRLYCNFRIELVSDIHIDGEPEERDLVLLKVLFPILFCYNFVCKLYIFCIHNINCIFNFVYNLQTLYPFCIQN